MIPDWSNYGANLTLTP